MRETFWAFKVTCVFCCQSDGNSDEVKREQMERLVREELERWDSESSMGGSGRGTSPSASSSGGRQRTRSRPSSSSGGAGGGVRTHFLLCLGGVRHHALASRRKQIPQQVGIVLHQVLAFVYVCCAEVGGCSNLVFSLSCKLHANHKVRGWLLRVWIGVLVSTDET